MSSESNSRRPWWRTKLAALFLIALMVAAIFVATGHRDHLVALISYSVLLACPLMHLFHHGHHKQRDHDSGGAGHDAAHHS